MCTRDAPSCIACTRVGTADKPDSLYTRRLLNQDLDAGYIRIEHAANNGAADEFDVNVRASIDDLSDEDNTRQGDEPEYFSSMARDDLSDRDGYMADLASDVDSPRSAHMCCRPVESQRHTHARTHAQAAGTLGQI